MKVIVDNCIWSLALRRQQQSKNRFTFILRDLIADSKVVIIGAIRQKIFSGIKHQQQYEKF